MVGILTTGFLIVVSGLSSGMENTSQPVTAPAVFWVSAPVKPGEVAMLSGGNLGKYLEVRIARVPDSQVSGKPTSSSYRFPATAQTLKIFQPTDHSVKFIAPNSLPMGLFIYQLTGKNGPFKPMILNQPDLWWSQGDSGGSAEPGGWIRIMGKCLAFQGEKTTILLEGSGGKSWRLTPKEASGWNLAVSLPQNLMEGEYRLRVHNGYGGNYGWSDALSIKVRRKPAWKSDLYNVVELGADPTGKKDSTLAVNKALALAETNRGGIVFFPRGRYMISDVLTIPRFTALRGESLELSCLFWNPGRNDKVKNPPVALIRGANSFGIEDLALYSQDYQHAIVGDLGDRPDAGDIFLRRVRVRANLYMGHLKAEEVDRRFRESRKLSTDGADTVRLGGRNIEITDCDFYGAGRAIFLSRVRDGYVARNTFYNGRRGWYCISGSDRLIFEKNRIVGADLMASGGGLNCLDGSSYSQNIYFAFNKLELMHGWDREAMTSDAGGGVYAGKITAVQGKRITLAEAPQWGWDRKGAGVFILDGRGKGQYRQLISHGGRNIEVDRPWDIDPDESSHSSITALQRNYLIIGNDFRDATCAVQFYGTSIGHVVAENKSWRAGGFHNIGMNYAGGWQPSWFVQFLDNEIMEGNQGFNGPMNEFPPLESHVAALGNAYAPIGTAMNRFTVIRGNKLHNNARIEIGGACEDVIVDGNLVENADVGITIGGSGSYHGGNPVGVLLHGNRFEKVHVPLADYTQKALTVPAD